MTGRVRLLTSTGVVASCLLAVVGAFILTRLAHLGGAPTNAGIGDVLGSLGFVAAGAFLACRRPSNSIGWLLLLVGLTEELANVAGDYGLLSYRDGGLPGGEWALWVGAWLWLPGSVLLLTVLVLLYPSGSVTSRLDRWLLRISLVSGTLATLALALAPGSVADVDAPTAVNPLAAHAVSTILLWAGGPVLALCVLISLASLGRRWWRAQAPLRQQLAWLFTAAVVTLVGKGLVPVAWISSASLALIPVAVAIGVLRYRLLGIETLVRRTLLYAPLTAAVAIVFTLLTAGLARLLPDGPLPNLISAAVVVLGIAPARDLLQRAVDRLVRGPRIDPLRAVAGVGAVALSGDDAGLVERVVQSVATALRSPYVAVLDPNGCVVASHGAGVAAAMTREVPLRDAERDLGRLVVAGQPGQDLLAALAPQVAVVVRAAGLNAELDAARQHAIGAALVERSRLRRDLHDGLGPSLSGVALGLEAAANVQGDPAAVHSMITRVRAEVSSAVAEVHRLLDGLRPSDLETFGLSAALRERLTVPGAGPDVVIDAPAALPPLRPDVELAAFRIVSEAVTNVRKHSAATRCDVSLRFRDGALRLRVSDDGVGISPDAEGGVGLISMRQRAEEVGGWLRVGTQTRGGTLVEAELPAMRT